MSWSNKVVFFSSKTSKPSGVMKIRAKAALENVSECLQDIAESDSGSLLWFTLARRESNLLPVELEQLVGGTACNWRLFPWGHPQRSDVSCRLRN